eukprot:GILK01008308.1.p1 GENE.GILK01008308.1~~GILK01008308.1.p1  ORF type:complete len:203 (-),score=11.93 GILK01008308.1:82-690(-)
MVYGFLIHSLTSARTLYFSIFFTPEGNNDQKKIRQQTITRKILEEHLFRNQCHEMLKSSSSYSNAEMEWFRSLASSEHKPRPAMTDSLDTNREGVFRIPADSSFSEPKFVVWQQSDSIAYTLICEPYENLLLANNFISLFITTLRDHFRVGPTVLATEIVSHPDDILVFLSHFLPCGQLLFTNLHLAKHLASVAEAELLRES